MGTMGTVQIAISDPQVPYLENLAQRSYRSKSSKPSKPERKNHGDELCADRNL